MSILLCLSSGLNIGGAFILPKLSTARSDIQKHRHRDHPAAERGIGARQFPVLVIMNLRYLNRRAKRAAMIYT